MPDIVAYLGHQVHLARALEMATLRRWLGDDLGGNLILDVAGGDGYWAGQLEKNGARAVCLDLDPKRLDRGNKLNRRPMLVRGDALRLPFVAGSFDSIISVCAIEHFTDGGAALAEMARVLKKGGRLLLSADALTSGAKWPQLLAAHKRRYYVETTYDHDTLGQMLLRNGFEPVRRHYLFRSDAMQRLYLTLSKARWSWNLAAPLIPLIRLADGRDEGSAGAIVVMEGRRGTHA